MPIVAFGKNGATLHYNHNNAAIKGDGLLLVDAGGELHGYASDITRTYPVSGRFSPDQRTLYSIVLRAQNAVINKLAPGQQATLFIIDTINLFA